LLRYAGDPAKREILWQRTRSPYLQEMYKETKGNRQEKSLRGDEDGKI